MERARQFEEHPAGGTRTAEGETAATRRGSVAVVEQRVIWLEPPIVLGTVTGRAGERWRVRTGSGERLVRADPSVDPALLDEAAATGARVVLDTAGEPVVAGVLLSARPLAIDRAGDVKASVRSLDLRVERDAVLATASSFVRVAADGVELYGRKVLTRAREVAKVLARLIALN